MRKFYTTLPRHAGRECGCRGASRRGKPPDAWQVVPPNSFWQLCTGSISMLVDGQGERAGPERRLVTKLRRRARRNAAPGLPDNARRRIRQLLADEETHFQPIRRRFLMVDLFSENEQRFLLTRDDCVSWWEEQRAAYEVLDWLRDPWTTLRARCEQGRFPSRSSCPEIRGAFRLRRSLRSLIASALRCRRRLAQAQRYYMPPSLGPRRRDHVLGQGRSRRVAQDSDGSSSGGFDDERCLNGLSTISQGDRRAAHVG